MSEVVVLVPAHNERERLPATLDAIWQQSVRPSRVVVVDDNSTDGTGELARASGSDVFRTVGNRDKKAGALNQALEALDLPDETYVLIVDADSVLSPLWIETALEMFRTRDRIGAVGGIFLGDGENGWFGSVQGLEYHRYRKELRRLRGEARVLTGTSTMTTMGMFRAIRTAREEGRLPGRGYYNLDALTEDFELTVCIKRLGWRTVSPDTCTVVTETMPDVPHLWRQRVRWQRGALDVLTMHGLNRVTAGYAWRQVETGIGVVVNTVIWLIAGWFVWTGMFQILPLWVMVGVVFYLERVQSAIGADRKGVIVAVTMVMDMVYDLFISGVYVWCLFLAVSGRERTWGQQTIDLQSERA